MDYILLSEMKMMLWVLNLIGNNAFSRGVHLNPL